MDPVVGVALIDEPEAALSATRQLALLARMHVLIELFGGDEPFDTYLQRSRGESK